MEGVGEQRANTIALYWARIWIGTGNSELRSAFNSLLRHAEVLEGDRRTEASRKTGQSVGCSVGAQSPRHGPQRLAGRAFVIGDRVRQHDGMGLGMRKVEAAAEHVA